MIQTFVVYPYFATLISIFLIGVARYRILDKGTKTLYWMMVVTLTAELMTTFWPHSKSKIYHFYNLLEIVLITWYFLQNIQFRNLKVFAIASTFYVAIEICNTLLYQSLAKFNSNFIIFECLLVIPMSLYSLYKIMINDKIDKLQSYVHFWFWTAMLVYFSSSFFFWPFVVYFFKHNKLYFDISSSMHALVNQVFYTIILIVFVKYPKMTRDEY